MTRTKSFITATARRRKDPLIWEIDDQVIHLRAEADIIEVADLAGLLQEGIPPGPGQTEGLLERKEAMVKIIVNFLEPESVETFKALAPGLEFMLLVDMCNELKDEYSGASNPTQEQSSSDKSPEAGSSSTVIAPLEDSTLPVSPLIEP